MTNDDLSPDERAAFASLPREELPPRDLEDLTVEALHQRGLLGGVARPARRGWRLSTGGLALAATAACAAVIGAFALGQDLGSRQTRTAMLAMHEQDASVQQAGAAYVAALSELAHQSDGLPRADERAAAMNNLYQVADQMVRLAPDDPLAARILQAFEQAETPPDGQHDDDQIIWF
ncbi:MAG: hypothetical protein GY838_13805 [bacterium]|nr:hypothetical protein [bacterium]